MVDGFFLNRETLKIELWVKGDIVFGLGHDDIKPNTTRWDMIRQSVKEVDEAWDELQLEWAKLLGSR